MGRHRAQVRHHGGVRLCADDPQNHQPEPHATRTPAPRGGRGRRRRGFVARRAARADHRQPFAGARHADRARDRTRARRRACRHLDRRIAARPARGRGGRHRTRTCLRRRHDCRDRRRFRRRRREGHQPGVASRDRRPRGLRPLRAGRPAQGGLAASRLRRTGFAARVRANDPVWRRVQRFGRCHQ